MGKLYLYLLLHPYNGLFSRTTWVSQYQKGKTSLDLNDARAGGVLEMAVASAGPYANNLHLAPDRSSASTPHHPIFTHQMLFLMLN